MPSPSTDADPAPLPDVRDDDRPVLIGAGQLVQRDAEPREALEPLEMLERVACGAAEDAGVGGRALRDLDTVALVNAPVWRAGNQVRLLAERLGAHPSREYTTAIGGEVGVTAVNFALEKILAGEARLALVAGCNNLRTFFRAQQQGIELDWAAGGEGTPEILGDDRPGNSALEKHYGFDRPSQVYPAFENALRAARGLELDAHRAHMGRLMSRFTEVAAANPYAWFPTARSPEEIVSATPQNRMVAFPYTKYLNAVLNTDQAAALLMCSAGTALELGVAPEKLVYWWGGAAKDETAWFASERPSFAACPSMLDSGQGALDNAGVGVDDLDFLDFYSCFPVAVEMAALQLGIAEDDPRGLTVTGGLPYAGGPASAYCLHSLACMAERLREKPGSKGLVTGNGWYLTKHAASVWSSAPKPGAAPHARLPERLPSQAAGMETTPVEIAVEAQGAGTVEAYTVVYDRSGAPERGIVLGRIEDGRRFLAHTPDDRALLEAFVAEEQVGRQGRIDFSDERNRFDPS